MTVKDKILKKWYDINPISKKRRNTMRKSLKNKDITLFCPNCIGGLLFHDLGLKFCSPTVNLMMLQTDFVKFMLDRERYLNTEFEFFNHKNLDCPCAKLDDITVHFTHYKTPDEAKSKWDDRAKRINPDNTFILMIERDGITKEDIASLANLNVRGIVVFTAHDYADIPYAFYVPDCVCDNQVDSMLKRSFLSGQRDYDKYFDFVKWFNEANGKDYDISPYVKR